MAIGQSDLGSSSFDALSSQVSLSCIKLILEIKQHWFHYVFFAPSITILVICLPCCPPISTAPLFLNYIYNIYNDLLMHIRVCFYVFMSQSIS